MKYEEAVKKLTKSNKSCFDRGDMIIRDCCKLITDIQNYRYTYEHYKGGEKNTVLQDKLMTIKNSLGIMKGDVDTYTEMLGITDLVEEKSKNRIIEIAEKIGRD